MLKRSYFTGSLLKHQQDAVDKLSNSDAILLFHSMGAGKTATSIAASEGGEVDVVVPAALRENYKKEIQKFTKNPSKRNIISYNRFTKEGPSYGADTLVMDEVQRIGRAESQMSQRAVDSAKYYKKRIILSGTPSLNSPRELSPVIRLLSPDTKDIPLDPTNFNKKFMGERKIPVGLFDRLRGIKPGVEFYPKNTEILRDAIKGKVHYYKTGKEDYPKRYDETREVEASDQQAKIYKYVTNSADPIIAMKVKMNLPLSKKESNQINAFMTAARQVSNTGTPYGGTEESSNKMKAIADDVELFTNKNKNHKSLIYSNYIESGLKEIENELDKKGIKYTTFTGSMTDRARKDSVDKYNAGEVNAMLVSGAGSEGLDTKGTRAVHITEPHWNKNRIEQVIARAIRYKSHDHLPEKDRDVKVIKYQTVLPKTMMQKIFKKDPYTSADQYLENLSDEKQDLLDKYLQLLKEEGGNVEGKMKKEAFLKRIYNKSFFDELTKTADDDSKKITMTFDSDGVKALGSGIVLKKINSILNLGAIMDMASEKTKEGVELNLKPAQDLKNMMGSKARMFMNNKRSLMGGGGAFDPSDGSVSILLKKNKLSDGNMAILSHELGHSKNFENKFIKKIVPHIKNLSGKSALAGSLGAAFLDDKEHSRNVAIIGSIAPAVVLAEEITATGRGLDGLSKFHGGFSKGLGRGGAVMALKNLLSYGTAAAVPLMIHKTKFKLDKDYDKDK